MTYGTIKIDTVTFTDAGVDKSVTLSGLVQNPTFSGNVTVTGTLSGVTVTGTTANFTSGNFTNISGGTHTITSGVFAAGSAASPSITFTGDLNTGIYSPGADQVAISTGGTGRITIDGSGNVNIDSNTLYVDATNNRVGIGTTSPIRLFHALDSANSIVGRVESGQSSSWLQFAASGTGTASRIGDPGGSVNAGLAFMTADTERARIDSSGRLLVGTSTGRNVGISAQVSQQIETAGSTYAGLAITSNRDDGDGSYLVFGKSRGTTVNSNTLVQTGDLLGMVAFAGGDGTDLLTRAAMIEGRVDGTPGANDMPGRLVFSTTADGASSPTERLRITSAGVLQVADAGNIAVGTTTGTKIGTATTQKLGFYNATPVVQPAAVADATDAATVITQLNDLLAKLRTLGIIAT